MTLAAPPRLKFSETTRSTGTGASGDNRSTSPQTKRSSIRSPTTSRRTARNFSTTDRSGVIGRSIQKFIVVSLVLTRHLLKREVAQHTLPSTSAHRAGQRRRLYKAADGIGQRPCVSGRDENAGIAIANCFGQTADPRRDHRFPCRHCLKRSDSQSFKEGRHDHEIDAGEEFRHVADEAQKARFCVDVEPLRLILQFIAARTVAGNAIFQLQSSRFQLRRGLEQEPLPLALLEDADAADGFHFAQCIWTWVETRRIDAA